MGIKSYYVRTDEGLELMHLDGIVKITKGIDGFGDTDYYFEYSDGSGFHVYDYVSFDGSKDDLRMFLNRNCNK